MPQLYAVIRTRGQKWNPEVPLEKQEDWRGHADFMNGLHADGLVVFGGPLEGTPDVLLIVRANGSEEIRARLAGDCWTSKDLLRIKQIIPWTLRLGSLG